MDFQQINRINTFESNNTQFASKSKFLTAVTRTWHLQKQIVMQNNSNRFAQPNVQNGEQNAILENCK